MQQQHMSPLDDLRTLAVWEFAERYEVPTSDAIRWRAFLLDRSSGRQRGAKDANVRAILRSTLNTHQLSQCLCVTTTHARRMRRDLRAQESYATTTS